MERDKPVKNLYRALQSNPQSVFYATNKISKNLLKKAKNAAYEQDEVFLNLYDLLDDKDFTKNENLPLVTPFVEKRTNIDRSTLYSFSKPFEAVQADIANIRFLEKSAADPKYCLLFVALFNSKIYVYPMKNRSLFVRKIELFYNDIKNKRTGKMPLQKDKEFDQNKIKKLNKEFDVGMYQRNLCCGKAFAAEQKIREFKKILLKSKRIDKIKKRD